MDLGLSDRSCILVGGTRGMGFATARILAEEGARITLIGRDAAHARAQAGALVDAFGVAACGLAADGAREDSLTRAIGQSIERFGPPFALLTTNGATDRNSDLLQMSDADWCNAFEDVLMGQVRACRAVLPAMMAAGGGQIVVTAAYSARVPKPSLFGYAAMKAALVNVTKNMAKTYGPSGIRANCICPGAIATDRFEERLAGVMAERGLDRDTAETFIMHDVFKMPTGLGRPGKAAEVADLMAFVLSGRAGYLSGATINIDGGTDF